MCQHVLEIFQHSEHNPDWIAIAWHSMTHLVNNINRLNYMPLTQKFLHILYPFLFGQCHKKVRYTRYMMALDCFPWSWHGIISKCIFFRMFMFWMLTIIYKRSNSILGNLLSMWVNVGNNVQKKSKNKKKR